MGNKFFLKLCIYIIIFNFFCNVSYAKKKNISGFYSFNNYITDKTNYLQFTKVSSNMYYIQHFIPDSMLISNNIYKLDNGYFQQITNNKSKFGVIIKLGKIYFYHLDDMNNLIKLKKLSRRKIIEFLDKYNYYQILAYRKLTFLSQKAKKERLNK